MRFEKLKDSALNKADELLRDGAYKSVVKDLTNDEIDIKDLSEDEFEQLFFEEYQRQKNLTKGAGVGAGVALLLSLLG
jgi:hypothetical protein